MPRSLQRVRKRNKRAKAARASFLAKQREELMSVTSPRANGLQGPNSDSPNIETLFEEDERSAPLELEIEIKEEPLDMRDSPTQLQTLNEDVDLPDTENSEDPSGQDSCQLLLSLKDNARCRFCLQYIRQVDKRNYVLRQRVISVLGASTGRFFARAVTVKCCESCKKLIDQFYEFKQVSVAALTQSEKYLTTFVERRKTRPSKKSNTLKVSSGADEVNSKSQLPSGTDWDIPAPEINPRPTAEDHSDSPYFCDRCKKRFATETCYIRHKPFCTNESKPPKTPIILSQCPQCPKKFRSQKNFTLHTNWHNGIRTIPCQREGCDKMFFDTYDCQKHEQLCGQDAQVLCNICGALFHTEVYLRRHLIIHEDPKFTCEVCHKGFHRKRALIKHATVHSGERKFKCDVCGKRFKSHEANRVHKRIHTQQKPYVCQVCGERFRLNCLLKAHVGKVHGTEPREPKEAQ